MSTDAAGTEGNGESNRPSISGDATRALFSSEATNLTPATPDTNLVRDVFLHELGPFPEVWPFQQGADGLVSIEAEHLSISLLGRSSGRPLPNTNRLEPWKPIPVADASRGEAIQADPAWPQTLDVADAPLIGYAIRFEQAGPHYVWIRARSFSPQGDAYGIALNQGPEIRRFVEPDDGQWVWRRGWTTIDVTGPGEHRLWINRRERSVEIDKIVVTPGRGYRPEGKGPPESPRSAP